MKYTQVLIIPLSLVLLACSDHVAKGLAMKGITRYANKEFSKIDSISKHKVLESPYNILIYITVKGDDLEKKKKELNWCACLRKDMGKEKMLMTRANICTPINLDQYKDTCKYPNDVDPEMAKELGISVGKDLFDLALRGDVNAFERAMKEGENNINKKFNVGNLGLYTPVHAAVFNNDLSMLDFLIGRNASVNVFDQDNNTPLHYEKMSFEIMEKLVSAGANLNIVNNRGETPLFLHMRQGQRKMVDFLIEKGAKLDLVNEYGENLINILITSYVEGKWDRKNFMEVLEMLALRGVSLDNKSKVPFNNRDYPIVTFCEKEDLEILKLIGKLKVNVNRRSNKNSTPLMIALRKKNTSIVEFLMSQGADPNLGDGDEVNPLYLAIPDMKMVEYLLDRGFKLNYANIHGLIQRAEELGSKTIAEMLKKEGAAILAEESGTSLQESVPSQKEENNINDSPQPEIKSDESQAGDDVKSKKNKKSKGKKR